MSAASHATAEWGSRVSKPVLGCRIGWLGLMGWSGYATDTEVAQLSSMHAQRRAWSGRNQKQRRGSEFVKWHDIYTPEECADEWRQNNDDLKLLENCVMNGFIMFGIMFMTATGLDNSPVIWRLQCFTVSFSGDVRGEFGPRKLASVNWRTPQWARSHFTRTIIPDWFE